MKGYLFLFLMGMAMFGVWIWSGLPPCVYFTAALIGFWPVLFIKLILSVKLNVKEDWWKVLVQKFCLSERPDKILYT